MIKDAIKFVTGYNSLVRVKTIASKVLDLDALKKTGRDIMPKKRNYRTETFNEAVTRLCLTPETLDEIKRGFVKQEIVWRITFYLTLTCVFVFTFFWSGVMALFGMAAMLGVTSALLFRAAFRGWQLSKGAFLPVKEFLVDAGLYRMFVSTSE